MHGTKYTKNIQPIYKAGCTIRNPNCNHERQKYIQTKDSSY